MAKQRQNAGGPATDSPGGEAGAGREGGVENLAERTMKNEGSGSDDFDEYGDVEGKGKPLSERNSIERAMMHLEFLERELRRLVEEKCESGGVIRRTAAKMRQQIDSQIAGWMPVKVIRTALQEAQAKASSS